ncbi:protein 1 [Plasmodium coatneyi]|uniref:Protein 1 n=1 Tax=Plasmodium coatneyi TaxID=208452 RepID=A0A1B1E6H9_9APIC|nr:protein 1 [Plasmodium coatneyi]ANQ10644.1 protein 1 [Plasmodium coatneyi]
MIAYASSLLVLFYALYQNVSSGIQINGERKIENHQEAEEFNVDDINAWMKLDDENFLKTWTKNVSDISFMETKSVKSGGSEDGDRASTGSGKGSNADWNFMSQQSEKAKSTKTKSNSGESDSSSSGGKSGHKSPASIHSDYTAYDSGMTSSVGSRAFEKEMYEFALSHPMERLGKEMDILKNEYIKVKDEEQKVLNDEHKEIEGKRKEERLKMLAESDGVESQSNEEENFVKKDYTDTKIRGGFTEFLSNLNPFKKEIKPMKKEISMVIYTPEQIVNKEMIMKELDIYHKYQPYPPTILHTCPNSMFFFDGIEGLRRELERGNEKELVTNKIIDHNNECMKNFGLFDFELPDNKTKFGNVIGSLGEYHIRLYEIENDLLKYQSGLDYLSLADDYKLVHNDISTLENINFCLLNPKTLEDFLKKNEIVKLMGEDPVAYEEKFTKYMEESIKCHLESLIYDDLDSSQDIKIVLKNVKSKLYLLQNGLTSKSKKLVNKLFNDIQKEPEAVFEKLTWIFENMYHLKRNYTFFAFKTVCDRFVTHHNIYNSIQKMTSYIMEHARLYGACFKNLIVYNAVISGIHEQMKNLFKLMPRTGLLVDIHFDALLQNENKKITRTDYVLNEYDPTIKAYALTQLERLPMVSVINSFFEAKKKKLSRMIAQMKLDLFSLANEDLKIPNDKGPTSKLTAKLISLYKEEIKKYFKEMRDDYVYLIKTRYKGHYKRNYLLYKRLE